MRHFIREPLLHFVLLGAALFALDALMGRRTAPAGGDEIVVSRGRIENLAALFAKTWQRPPSAPELRTLVDDFVLEEALYREGKALGVDVDDTIIRRRVRQKMEFAVDDIIEQAAPTEPQLEAWLAEHADRYTRPARFRFRQLYVNPELHGDDPAADARAVLADVRALGDEADPRELGDPSLLEHAYRDASAQDVIATFGAPFLESVAELPIGEWSGPVKSAFGLHIVRVDARDPGALPPLDDVRAEVERDWASAQRDEASKRFYDGLVARYRVVVEWPQGTSDGSGDPGGTAGTDGARKP